MRVGRPGGGLCGGADAWLRIDARADKPGCHHARPALFGTGCVSGMVELFGARQSTAIPTRASFGEDNNGALAACRDRCREVTQCTGTICRDAAFAQPIDRRADDTDSECRAQRSGVARFGQVPAARTFGHGQVVRCRAADRVGFGRRPARPIPPSPGAQTGVPQPLFIGLAAASRRDGDDIRLVERTDGHGLSRRLLAALVSRAFATSPAGRQRLSARRPLMNRL